MKSNHLISIIIPFYKGERYISNAISSVINQTYENFELLLIENGPKDKSEEIIKKYHDKRIYYYYIKEGNVSNARNFGIEKAKGKYIYFMDGDDTIDKDCIQTCVKKLIEKKVDMVMFSIKRINKNNITYMELPWNKIIMDEKAIKEKLIPMMIYPIKKEKSIMGSTCRLFTKAEYIKKIRFNSEIKIAEDLLFCIELFSIIKNVYIINKPFYNYTSNGSSALNSYKKDTIYNSVKLHLEMEKILKKYNLINEILKIRFYMNKGRMYTNAISFSSRCPNKKQALKEIETIIAIYKKDNYNYIKLEYPKIIKLTFILMNLNMKRTILFSYLIKEKIRKMKYK